MIILNEKEYAEEILKEPKYEKKPFKTLTILAKYYCHHEGLKRKKIAERLMEYVEEYCLNYSNNRMYWEETVDKLAKNAKKYKLHEINGVWITSKELATIKSINNALLERLAFTLLCLAKLGNLKNPSNSGWVNNNAKEIFTLARVACSVKERYENLNILGELGLLEFPKRLDNLNVRVTYMDLDGEGENVLFINDFRELGYEYLNYYGGNFTRCCECGRLFRNNKKRDRRYCNQCISKPEQPTKEIECVDCGKVFTVLASVNTKCRCDECQKKKKREYTRLRVQKHRGKIDVM